MNFFNGNYGVIGFKLYIHNNTYFIKTQEFFQIKIFNENYGY